VLFSSLFWFHGVPEPTTTVGSVADCVVAVRADQQVPACRPTDPEAPSKAAGMRKGDRIVAFGSTPITSYTQLQRLIRANGAKTVFITVERGGKQQVLRARTAVNELPSLTDTNVSVDVGYLGIVPTEDQVSKSPLYTLGQMGGYTRDTASALVHLPVRLWGVARAAVGLQKRSADSPISVVGVGRIAGQYAADKQVSTGDKVAFVVSLLAGVNLFLGMFNFVPLLPLDGGHIAGALYEAVRRAWARLRRRPDPGYFDVARLLPVAYVTAGLLLVMTVVLVYADIVHPVST
jgi:membrane-associated protease RseP (regulator of RpoE activity)